MRSIILIISLCCGVLYAQGSGYTQSTSDNAEKQWENVEEYLDSIEVSSIPKVQRQFEPNFQDRYDSAAFDYTKSKPRESAWSKVKRFLNELLDYLFDFDDVDEINQYTDWTFNIIAVIVLGLVLYWLIKYMIGKDFSFFAKENKAIHPKDRTIQENIHAIDFDEIIQKYETQKQYRYAVRYQYLHLLKKLTDSGSITWNPDKTNVAYIQELKGHALHSSFQKLTKTFEYVWYGEFDIPLDEYELVKASFKNIQNKVR